MLLSGWCSGLVSWACWVKCSCEERRALRSTSVTAAKPVSSKRLSAASALKLFLSDTVVCCFTAQTRTGAVPVSPSADGKEAHTLQRDSLHSVPQLVLFKEALGWGVFLFFHRTDPALGFKVGDFFQHEAEGSTGHSCRTEYKIHEQIYIQEDSILLPACPHAWFFSTWSGFDLEILALSLAPDTLICPKSVY